MVMNCLVIKLAIDSNKALLHVDAKRLFLNEDDGERGWDTRYDIRYRSRRQRALHAERDGIAFASIAFPAHYSAILAVLHHSRKRLGPSWTIQNVVEWGAGTGSGLWYEKTLHLHPHCLS
jgi:ribosomal protein RSM22 (predicted rRNA methylase)